MLGGQGVLGIHGHHLGRAQFVLPFLYEVLLSCIVNMTVEHNCTVVLVFIEREKQSPRIYTVSSSELVMIFSNFQYIFFAQIFPIPCRSCVALQFNMTYNILASRLRGRFFLLFFRKTGGVSADF